MKTRRARAADGEVFILFWCPGCEEYHGPRVEGGASQWGWNGDRELPTFTPSILVRGKRRLTEDEYQRILAGEQLEIPDRVCHTFVTLGRISFLGDCTHALAGQTVDIPDDPDSTPDREAA
jgi:hypothetical protein